MTRRDSQSAPPKVSAERAIVVIGGGLQGLITAYELARAGQRVTVLDDGGPRATSWAAGGILSPLHPWRYTDAVSRLAVWSQRAYPALCAELTAETGVSPEWVRSGMLVLAADVAAAKAWAPKFDAAFEIVPAEKGAGSLPGLAPQSGDAVWMPDIAQVRSPRLLRALRLALTARGVEMHAGVRVTGFAARSGRLSAILTSAGDIPTSYCVVTAGAWTAALLADTGFAPPIEPVCGQMLLLAGARLGLNKIVLRDSFYLIPRADGVVLVGSTLEHRGFDRATTPAARTTLLAEAQRILPAAAQCEVIDQWAGLRPGSPQGVPFIGAHPTIAGLYINAGHYRNGIVLAPASARLVADLMLARPPVVDPTPYLPALPRGQ